MITIRPRTIVETYPFNFSRSSLAYDGAGRVYSVNQARLVPGKFGNAVLVEEGTTNLVPNPLAKDNLVGIAPGFYGGSAGTVERSTSLPAGCPWATGVKVMVTVDGDANVIFKQTDGGEAITGIPVTAGATYTYSIWLYIPPDSGITKLILRPIEWGSNGAVISDNFLTSFATKGVWQRVTATWTLQSTTAKVTLRVRAIGSGGFYATACMLENKPYATSFIDGTRSPETLTIPTAGVLSPTEGTVECRLPAGRRQYGTDYQFILDIGGTGVSGAYLAISPTGYLQAGFGDGSQLNSYSPMILDPAQEYYVALKWAPGYYAICVNGTFWTRTFAHNFTPYDKLYIGCNAGSSRFFDGLIDDLRISSIARSDTEIQAAYQSGQPLPVDQYTTLKLDFDAPLVSRPVKVIAA